MSKQLSTFLLLTFVAALLLLSIDAYVENSDGDEAALSLSPVDANAAPRGGGSNNKKKKKKKKQRRRRKKKKNQKKKSSSSSSSGFNQGRINRKYEDLTAYELLEYKTDTAGPNKGFFIVLQLIDAAGLQDEVDGLLQDFTLFAPNDQAFCRTATNDLGYKGGCNPPDADDVLEYYVDVLSDLAGDDEAVLGDILVGILTYHVADGRMSVQDLRRRGHFGTLCDCNDIEVKKVSKRKTKLYDAASKYPNIDFREQNMAVEDDGMVHVIKGVLLPSFEDIPDPDVCPPDGGVDCVFAPENQHRCGDCFYMTICGLEAAGFDRVDDCCQQPPSDTFCTDEYKPVACGDKKCEYDNMCFATSSGYKEFQCSGEDVKCPEKEPDSGSRCNGNQEGLSCNLGDEYGGDRYCWKDCSDGVWVHLCAVDDGDGGGGVDKNNIILGGDPGPQKPFQCSSLPSCMSCLDHPSCDGWAGSFGCYSTCSYDKNDPQSLKKAGVSCYDSSNGGCDATRTDEMDYRTCSEQTTCDDCTRTKKYGGGSCHWFFDDYSYVGAGSCSSTQGMRDGPIDECPEVSIAF